ncbi:MAG: hypothetical protein KAR54_03280 [Candidatus Pacebacteria bacterium]|nr:hypothetical protein [Candidatus Paceibacterota bacterium]
MKQRQIEIIPAILPKNLKELEDKLNSLKEVYAKLGTDKPTVQVDITYGGLISLSEKSFAFIHEIIIQMKPILSKFNFNFEIDVIVDFEDEEDFKIWRELDVGRIIFHHESKLSNKWLKDFNSNIELGISLKPKTSTEDIFQYLENIDVIQFMGIDNVGYQGQTFNPDVINKIEEYRKENPDMIISVDGGVNLENAQKLIDAGTNRLVIGSAIFGKNNFACQQAGSVQEILEKIKEFENLSN